MKFLTHRVLFALPALCVLAGCSNRLICSHALPEAPPQWQYIPSCDAAIREWPDGCWWHVFANEELNGLIACALEGGLDLYIAQSRIRQAEANLLKASASFFPSIDGLFSTTRRKSPNEEGGSTGSTSYEIQLDTSYEVDLRGKNRAQVRSAKESVNAARYEWERTRLNLIVSIATTYFQLLATQDRIALNQQSEENLAENLALIDKRYKAGSISQLDLLQQRTLLERVRAILPSLQQQRIELTNALAVLVGIEPERIVLYGGSLDEVAAPRHLPTGIPSELICRRPDLLKAEADLKAARADIHVAKTAFFPSLTLSAQGGFRSSHFSDLLSSDRIFSQIAAQTAGKIIDNGALRADLLFTRARHSELLYFYHQTILSAFREVENALAGIDTARRSERAQEIVFSDAAETSRLAKSRYFGGRTDLLTLLDAQRSQLEANDAYIQAQLVELNSYVNLFSSLGG